LINHHLKNKLNDLAVFHLIVDGRYERGERWDRAFVGKEPFVKNMEDHPASKAEG
jgi:hypothetical protein